MLRDAWFLARKDVSYMLREKETLLWLFVMPIVFFYFIGTVTSGFGSPGGTSSDPLALRAPEGAGFLADQVVRRLEDNDFEVHRPESDEQFAAASRRLTLPEGFTDAVLRGEEVTVEFRRADGGIAEDYDALRVGRAVYTMLADVIAAEEAALEPGPEAFEALEAMPRALTLEVKPAGKRPVIPTGFEQTVPGILVMFTLVALLTGGAVLLVVERNQGLLRRLASTPIRRGSVVLGKWGGKMALGLVQIGWAMLTGTVLFGMDWGPDLAMILLVLLAWGSLCASLGLLLGVLSRTEGQTVAIGVLTGNVLAALGGCWWPIEITPAWMQTLQKALPTGWAMDALHRLISFQSGAASALPHVLVMFSAALVLGWIAARRFRFQ